MDKQITPYQMVMINTIEPTMKYNRQIRSIFNEYDKERRGHIQVLWLCQLMFHYGFMMGKKEERQRRKHNIERENVKKC